MVNFSSQKGTFPMSHNTQQMRKHIRGEVFADWLARQRRIDDYQVKEIDPNMTWSMANGWGESYDVDFDERQERRMLKQYEDELWHPELQARHREA
jgi:hypothetical protein